MDLQPRIETLHEKKLVGKKLRMSLLFDRTSELWRSFMPERRKIQNAVSNELISMRVYDVRMEPANAAQQFDKWAAVEVAEFNEVSENMESLVLKGGLYAVFDYEGLNTDNTIFIYIFKDWLPSSNYQLDNRPQFEVLGEHYRNNDPASREEIWIPVKLKEEAAI
jgi:AraC family transcriptional regulator